MMLDEFVYPAWADSVLAVLNIVFLVALMVLCFWFLVKFFMIDEKENKKHRELQDAAYFAISSYFGEYLSSRFIPSEKDNKE